MQNYLRAMIASTLMLMVACDDDVIDINGSTQVTASARYSPRPISSGRVMNDLNIESFTVNVAEIEFEFDDNDDDDDDRDDDYELRGPFELQLVNGGDALTKTIAELNLPSNNYEEIEFDIKKSRKENSAMYNKSILVEGTIGGTPFIFWHNKDDDFEIEFDDDFKVGKGKSLVDIAFRLDLMFNAALIEELENASDGNKNGTIEISPGDLDGNQQLADKIWNRLENAIDIDDWDDDDD